MIKLSHTSVTTYGECPFKFYLKYHEKLQPKKKGSPLVFGSAVDEGLTYLLKHKDEPNALEKALETFVIYWSQYKTDNIKYSKSDFDPNLGETEWLGLNEKGCLLIEQYYKDVIPKIKKVLATQLELRLENEDGDIIKGFIDLIVEWHDGSIIIFDNKTSSVDYKESSVSESTQLGLYKLILNEHPDWIGKITHQGFIVLSKKIKKTMVCKICSRSHNMKGRTCGTCKKDSLELKLEAYPIDIIIDNINEEFLDLILDGINVINNKIKAEKFEPNYNACKGKYGLCEFWKYCHEDGNMDGLEVQPERKK